MHYLITGHTGFKGSWLTLWLTSLGHTVSGIALNPVKESLYEKANISELVKNDFRIDIRKFDETNQAIKQILPDVVFHMAAQPLVRESYKDPRTTIETNAMGTLNILESVSKTESVKAHVVITTDKVYRNVNQVAGYVETDPLGGYDPYSASKAMADILTNSWVKSFNSPPTAVVRAGNVIGGGDVSPDRLIPDLITAHKQGRSPGIRFPNAIRPWQHVLDCLNGYLQIKDALLAGVEVGEINIGPGKESFVTVGKVVELFQREVGAKSHWTLNKSNNPHEAGLLALDASKAQELLGWKNKLGLNDSIKWTIDWHKATESGQDAKSVSVNQIENFQKIN
jgi:CDP-glucose 4,6-dehydratase